MLDIFLKKPLLMGILNVTPDSFYDKDSYFSLEKAIDRAKEICQQGADIIDIGGASSRPGASDVTEEEELRRVLPVIEAVKNTLSIPLSIDTSSPIVAAAAVEKGASLINDVTGFQNPKMREVAASCEADLCVMHMQGTPRTMQANPSYPEGIVSHLMGWFEKQIKLLTDLGIKESRIILDPGIGFGKNLEHNLIIFKNLATFKSFGLRILIGASRKSFMSKILNKPPNELLPATLAIHTISIYAGIDMIRVHDVGEHRDLIDLISSLKSI